MYKLLDNTGAVFALSPHIHPMMKLTEDRWAGTVVDGNGKVLFDIERDRKAGQKVTARVAQKERDLAWSRISMGN